MTHRIFISLGTNIERDKNLCSGLSQLEQHYGDLVLSSVYESEAVGFDGDNFYNMVISADVDDSLEAVIQNLKKIEDHHQRVRGGEKFSPRTLDLDLLLYDNVVCYEPVTIPRPEILFNAFVLQPLAQISPQSLHPINGLTYTQIWQEMNKNQKLWRVPLLWNGTEI